MGIDHLGQKVSRELVSVTPRVLVACEWSGRVRNALVDRGISAVSCDLRSSGLPGPHILGDVRDVLDQDWDLVIAFPPCTYLAVSGARLWAEREAEQKEAIRFVQDIWNCPAPRVAIENPVGKLSTAWRKPDQIIQPWQFGHGETKATCLWLRGLPKLEPTNIVEGREARILGMSNTRNRAKYRSLTYQGVADAMADQWGAVL